MYDFFDSLKYWYANIFCWSMLDCRSQKNKTWKRRWRSPKYSYPWNISPQRYKTPKCSRVSKKTFDFFRNAFLSNFVHFNRLKEVIYQEDNLYLIFEYCEYDLKKYIRSIGGPLPAETVKKFTYQIL